MKHAVGHGENEASPQRPGEGRHKGSRDGTVAAEADKSNHVFEATLGISGFIWNQAESHQGFKD